MQHIPIACSTTLSIPSPRRCSAFLLGTRFHATTSSLLMYSGSCAIHYRFASQATSHLLYGPTISYNIRTKTDLRMQLSSTPPFALHPDPDFDNGRRIKMRLKNAGSKPLVFDYRRYPRRVATILDTVTLEFVYWLTGISTRVRVGVVLLSVSRDP
ncbi:hypothetical protein K474DRAFT_209244 [Panus rudis PR-1116 ss-1]|nr:hypothetical protein K474DRAFT_209244 [Panus rudis PR-1116 ss-1]